MIRMSYGLTHVYKWVDGFAVVESFSAGEVGENR